MTSFFDTVSQLTHLTPEGKDALASVLTLKEAGRGEVLLNVDSVCNYVFYIESGLTRTFYYKDGKDVTDWISTEGTFAVSIVSFITRQPDRRGIEALENCRLYALHYADLEKLYSRHHDIERLGRLLVSMGLIQLQKRFDDLHFATAKERYIQILNETPTLVQRVPLGILASFLGITQETLSRIRSQAHIHFLTIVKALAKRRR